VELLLDTHAFLWWDGAPQRVGGRAVELISELTNTVFVSAASIWEIAIKRRLGKLAFDGSVDDALAKNGFTELPISGADAELAGALDWNHSDPFDRLIVAQAQARRLTLITADAAVQRFIGVAMVAAG
jgi:PIN domain nuclease of toxin-antitoxin system